LAQNRGVPALDVQKVCRQNDREVRLLFSDVSHDYFSSCIADEQKAREQLVKDWATFPALAKDRCAQPKEYLAAYVEWLTCLEMARDVMKMRKEQQGAATSKASSTKSGRLCPIVEVGADGSVISVVAC
jgi:hypothetical protein